MHKTIIVGLSAALVFVVAVSYGPAVRTAEVPQKALPGAASGPIDVMQMMRNAKDLPEEKYDAI